MQCQAVLTKSSGECVASGLKKGTYFFLDYKTAELWIIKWIKSKGLKFKISGLMCFNFFLLQLIFESKGISFK